MTSLKKLNIEKVAQAIEADAGESLPDIRQALAEAKAGVGLVHRPEEIAARKRGRPVGTKKADAKAQITIRLDSDVLTGLKALGPGWQTKANDALRRFVARSGKTAQV